LAIGIAGVGLVALLVAAGASAAFPGRNGPIAFTAGYGAPEASCPVAKVGENGIFTMDAGGGDATSLTDHPILSSCLSHPDYVHDGAPTVSPNGRWVAFTRFAGAERARIYLIRVDGTGLHPLTAGRGYRTGPSFSPDGKEVAFARRRAHRSGIYLISSDGGRERRLTSSGLAPTFFPGGGRIAFDDSLRGGGFGTFVVRSDGTHRRLLTAAGEVTDVSPDGKRIALQRRFKVYVMRSDGTHKRRLADGRDAVFSPNANRIAFDTSYQNGPVFEHLAVMGADGSNPRIVDPTPPPFGTPATTPLLVDEPDWGPG
jgi:Tol biopolymer transport system component